MKTLLLSALMVLVTVRATAQSAPKTVYINFANTVLGGTIEQGGGTFRDHARICGLDGQPISGSGADAGRALVALFYGTEGTGAADLRQAGAPTTFLDVPPGQIPRPGFFAGGRRDLIGIETTEPGPGPIVAFQLRVWWAADPRVVAASRLFYSRAGNPLNLPPDSPPNFSAAPPGGRSGFTGFGMGLGNPGCVPEPSVYALGLLGIGAGVFLRRRK